MVSVQASKAQEIKRRVGHPIVDADGHVLEFLPTMYEYIREELGSQTFDRYLAKHTELLPPKSLAQRRDEHLFQGGWLAIPSATQMKDMATAFLPKLLASRLDEIGIDYAILYGTYSTRLARLHDAEIRQGACRGVNRYWADHFKEYQDRMSISATIPMHTPEEAIAAVEHAHSLGLKTVLLPPGVFRPIPAIHRKYPELFPRVHWWDTYGMDSEHDYDPFWAKLEELRIAPTFHGGGGVGTQVMSHRSISSYAFNHMMSHAFLMTQLCKSLVMGGVTRRFPNLTFGFLECGIAWACQLLVSFEEHWEGRNMDVMESRSEHLDLSTWRELRDEWGGKLTAGKTDDRWLEELIYGWPDSPPEIRDEWRHMQIKDERDIADLFVPNLYFGCETDDPTVAFAWSKANAFGATLKPVLSSDIGHWDVNDMLEVLPTSYRLVEKGILTPEQWREFTYVHPAMLHLRVNPDFFKGTRIEAEAAKLLEEQAA